MKKQWNAGDEVGMSNHNNFRMNYESCDTHLKLGPNSASLKKLCRSTRSIDDFGKLGHNTKQCFVSETKDD